MNREVVAFGRGRHGISTLVWDRCSDFRSDMKSHTAKTWYSMKIRRLVNESIIPYSGCLRSFTRRGWTSLVSLSKELIVCYLSGALTPTSQNLFLDHKKHIHFTPVLLVCNAKTPMRRPI